MKLTRNWLARPVLARTTAGSAASRPLRTALWTLLLCGAGLLAPPAQANTIGMVVNFFQRSVTVFDADTGELLGVVDDFPGTDTLNDGLILPDQDHALVLGDARLFVLSLDGSTPVLLGGVIAIATNGQDLALSRDGKYVIVTGGSITPISVVDVASLTEVDTFAINSHSAVDTCQDGSVLVTLTSNPNRVARLMLSASGELSDTGQRLDFDDPHNVYCAPDGKTGVVIGEPGDQDDVGTIQSFLVDGMVALDSRERADSAIASYAVFHPGSQRLYVRHGLSATAHSIDMHRYNPDTGAIGTPKSVAAGFSLDASPGDTLAVHPDGSTLYFADPDAIVARDAKSLGSQGSLANPEFPDPIQLTEAPAALALSRRSGEFDVQIELTPYTGLGWLHPLRGALLTVLLEGSDLLDVSEVDERTLRFGPKASRPLLAGQISDANGDGEDDMLLFFRRSSIAPGADSREFCITGRRMNEEKIIGCQWLRLGS